MRILTLLACLLLVAGILPLTTSDAQAPSSRETRELIAEYCAPETSAERRAEIVPVLRSARESRTTGTIEDMLEGDETRPAAIVLIGELAHSEAWELLEEYLDSDQAEAVVDALMALNDDDVVSELLARWNRLEGEDPLFDILGTCFQNAGLPITVLDQMVENLADPARRETVTRILCTHFEMPFESEPEALIAYWGEHRREFQEQSRAFGQEDVDLIQLGQFVGTRSRPGVGVFQSREIVQEMPGLPAPSFLKRRGPNYLMELRQEFHFTDMERLSEQNHTVTMNFLPLNQPQGLRLVYMTSLRTYSCELVDDMLTLSIDRMGNNAAAQVRMNEWNTLTWEVAYNARMQSQRVRVRLNGQAFQDLPDPPAGEEVPPGEEAPPEDEGDDQADKAAQPRPGQRPGQRPGGQRPGRGAWGGAGRERRDAQGFWMFPGELYSIDLIAPQLGQVVMGGWTVELR